MTTTPAAAPLEAISLPESRDLIALESVIERGLETFLQVGEALATIRDRRLYRIEHSTFADYCKTKWKMSDRRARQLMDASEVVTAISKSGTTVPKSERQARPLAALPPAQRVEVWEKAVAASPNGQPTAKDVQGVVETMNANPPKTANVVLPRQIASEPDATKTPLQWLTYFWMEASEEDRRLFDNFRAGLRGGR
jgi:hypothetical protein